MPYDVRPLDLHDDALLDRAHAVMRAAALEDGRPWTTMWSRERMAVALRDPGEGQAVDVLGAWRQGTGAGPPAPADLLGVATAHRDLEANTDVLFVDAWVPPADRRQGVGSALVASLVDLARHHGRSRVVAEASVAPAEAEDGPTLRFARRHGFRVATTEVVRELALPVDDALLDGLERGSADRWQAYDVVLVDGVPDDPMLESYAALVNLLDAEAPSGELAFEAGARSAEAVAAAIRQRVDGGQRCLSAMAVHREDPTTVVAHSDLVVPVGVDHVHQEGTLVHPDHRGHRLGTLVKVAGLRQLQELVPGRRRVVTQNAEVNDAMIGINEALGFRAVAVNPGLLLELGDEQDGSG